MQGSGLRISRGGALSHRCSSHWVTPLSGVSLGCPFALPSLLNLFALANCSGLWMIYEQHMNLLILLVEGEQIINTQLICFVRADTKERMAQEWELAGRAEEGGTDSSVRFECLWGSGTGCLWGKLG